MLFVCFLFILTIFAGFYVAEKALAQTNNCVVSTPVFRENKSSTAEEDFYEEDDRPYVYIDIQTQNCMGDTLEFSLVGNQAGLPDSDIDALDNEEIIIGSGTAGFQHFTLVLLAGEENCLSTQDPDCQYYLEVETNDTTSGTITFTNIFSYDCETSVLTGNTCQDGSDWEYVGIVNYGNSATNDPHFNDPDIANGNTSGGNNNNNNPGGNTNTTGGGTATTTSAPTVINLNLVNPIASAIGSIPQFFQKLIDLIIKIAIPFVAIVLVYCGLLFVTARGDTSQIEKARNAFTYAIIGGLVLLSSWLIAEAIRDALINLAYVI